MNGSISWNEYFMFSAILASKRSKDPSTKVGAVVVNNEHRIVGTGYNGFPNGIDDSLLPWSKDSKLFEETKYAYVVHAESNCLTNSVKSNLKGCSLFVTLFPCSSCTKLIIQRGINYIIYLNECKDQTSGDHKASLRMLELAGIKLTKFNSDVELALVLNPVGN